MTLERLPRVAATGVDFVSMGALTHSARAADISFEIEPAGDDPPGGLTAPAAEPENPRMAEVAPGSEELVLAFLAEAADDFVSGEAISGKLGLSRAAVWKHVDALRGQGYRIDAAPGPRLPAGGHPRSAGTARDRTAPSTPTTSDRRCTAARSCPPRTTGPASSPTTGPITARW